MLSEHPLLELTQILSHGSTVFYNNAVVFALSGYENVAKLFSSPPLVRSLSFG